MQRYWVVENKNAIQVPFFVSLMILKTLDFKNVFVEFRTRVVFDPSTLLKQIWNILKNPFDTNLQD